MVRFFALLPRSLTTFFYAIAALAVLQEYNVLFTDERLSYQHLLQRIKNL